MKLLPGLMNAQGNGDLTDADQKSATVDNDVQRLAPGAAIIQQSEFLQSTQVKHRGIRTGAAMSLPHASSGDVISVSPLHEELKGALSSAIVRTPHIELIRSILHKGRSVPEHTIEGELTIQCIEGKLEVHAHGRTIALGPDELLFLAGGVPHSVHAVEDSSALLTLIRLAAPADAR